MGINLEILSVTKGNISGRGKNESENSDFGFCLFVCLLGCLIVCPIVSNVSVLSFFYCFDLISDEFEAASKYVRMQTKLSMTADFS